MSFYNRKAASEYARKWALTRNPVYYSYDKIRWRLHKFCFSMSFIWWN